MPEEPADIVLGHLRHIRARVDMIGDEVQGLGVRMSSMERHISGLHSSDVDQLNELD